MPSLFPLFPHWQECATAFLTHIHSMSDSGHSTRQYRRILYAFFTDVRKTPDQYTRSDVEKYLSSPTNGYRSRGNPPSASTRSVRLAVLRSFYAFAEDWIIIVDGKRQRMMQEPPPTVGITHGKRTKQHRTVLTEEEIVRLFAAIPTDTVIGLRDRAIYLVFFWCGRRRSEIARLRYGDLAQQHVTDMHGNRRMITVYRFQAKGKGGAYDTVELPAPAKLAIDRYLEVSGRIKTIQPGDPLFAPIGASTGGRPVDPSKPLSSGVIAWGLKKYLAKAGLDSSCSLHSLRHSAARERYSAGQDIRSIQQFLGHSNIATTDIYIRELMGIIDPGYRLLEGKFGNL